MRWLADKLGKLFSDVVTGVLIALVLSLLSSVWYLIKNNWQFSALNSWIIPLSILSVILMVVLLAAILLRKRARPSPFGMVSVNQEKIDGLFVGRKAQIDLFRNLITSTKSPYKVLWVHGLGGMGKSWLLEKFANICIQQGLPVAKVGCDDERLVFDILKSFSDQLLDQGVELDTFKKKIQVYRRIQAQLKEKSFQYSDLVKVVTSFMESSQSPAIQSAANIMGTDAAGHLVESLRTLLSEEDADLYLKPEGRLTSLFIDDLKKCSVAKRIVLVFDTYEQSGELDSWVSKLAERLGSSNVLVVIAGREKRSLLWNNMKETIKETELTRMDEKDAMQCVQRYQSRYGSNPVSPEQMNRLARFGNGLPLALSSSMYLVTQFGMQEFEAQSQNVIKSVLQTVIREARTPKFADVIDVCAVLRWFNEDTLTYMLNRDIARDAYDELSPYPFIIRRQRGLALHDLARDLQVLDLMDRSPKTFVTYHRKAAAYYSDCLNQLEAENRKYDLDWQEVTIELLYHKFQTAEPDSLEVFKAAFEDAQLNYPTSRNIYISLARDSEKFSSRFAKWIRYYEARLNSYSSDSMDIFRSLTNDPEIMLYARTSLGIALFNKGRIEEAVQVLRRNHESIERGAQPGTIDYSTLLTSQRYLALYLRIIGEFQDTRRLLEGTTLPRMQVELARAYYFLGRYGEAEKILKDCLLQFEHNSYPVRYSALACRYLTHIYLKEGRLDESRVFSRSSQEFGLKIPDTYLENLAICLLSILDKDLPRLTLTVNQLLADGVPRYERKSIVSKYTYHLASLMVEQGNLKDARHYLHKSLEMSEDSKYMIGVVRAYLGLLECDFLEGSYDSSDPRIAYIEQHCNYSGTLDYLAHLRYLQGRIMINMKADSDAALPYFCESFVAAIRFNRFVLDEIAGKIVDLCAANAILLAARLPSRLADFWRTGQYEGTPLVELEKRGREIETGDGAQQLFLLDRLDNVQ